MIIFVWSRTMTISKGKKEKLQTLVPLGSRRRRYALDFQITPKRSLNGFVADDIAGNQQAAIGIINKVGTPGA